MSNDDWCTIESDPGVFTSLIESFGTRNAEFAELWSLDDDALSSLTSPIDGVDDAAVHGLIFLFKWQSSSSSNIGRGGEQDEGAAAIGGIGGRGEPLTGDDVPPGLFFARQVTHNACATQAILSVLFNAPNSIVERGDGDDDGGRRDDVDDMNGRRLVLGGTLSDFRSFTSHFPPDLRGEAIGSSEAIRAAHNSFGRADDAFLGGDPGRPKRAATDDDDVFHFVAYVPHAADGCVYELDGLQPGPIRVGSYEAGEDDAGGGRVAERCRGVDPGGEGRDSIPAVGVPARGDQVQPHGPGAGPPDLPLRAPRLPRRRRGRGVGPGHAGGAVRPARRGGEAREVEGRERAQAPQLPPVLRGIPQVLGGERQVREADRHGEEERGREEEKGGCLEENEGRRVKAVRGVENTKVVIF